jgi:ribonucleoside-diphosphate reductase subunit M2
MNISAEGNFSVTTLKEEFMRAGRGKENATAIGKKHIIEESIEEKKHSKLDEEEEPLLVENKKRFVLFPIKYHEVPLRQV